MLPKLVECTEGLADEVAEVVSNDDDALPESEPLRERSDCLRPPLSAALAALRSDWRDSVGFRVEDFSSIFSLLLLPVSSVFLAESDIFRVREDFS